MTTENITDQVDGTEITKGLRAGQVMADFDSWKPNIEKFIASQPEVSGPVEVTDLKRPDTGTAGGNALFYAEADFGKGPEKRRFLLRYEPEKGTFDENDVPGVFKIHKALEATDVKCPKALWLDATGESVGAPAMVVEFVAGDVPKQMFFWDGCFAEASAADRKAMVTNFLKAMNSVHEVDWVAASLGFLQERSHGETPIERDINWYWEFLSRAMPHRVEEFRPAKDWLIANQPQQYNISLTHGDCQPGNYMFKGTGVSAVLDWEMTALLPREVDLAYFCIAYEGVSSLAGPALEGVQSVDDMIAEYQVISGYTLQDWDYYRTMMLFRLSAIMSGGFYRLCPTPEALEAARPMWIFYEDNLFAEIAKRS